MTKPRVGLANLAEAYGVHPSHISHIKRGKVRST